MAGVTHKATAWDSVSFDRPGEHLDPLFLHNFVRGISANGLTLLQWNDLILSLRDAIRDSFPHRWDDMVYNLYKGLAFVPSREYIESFTTGDPAYHPAVQTVARQIYTSANHAYPVSQVAYSDWNEVNNLFDKEEVRILQYINMISPLDISTYFFTEPDSVELALNSEVDFTDLFYVVRTNQLGWFKETLDEICENKGFRVSQTIRLPCFRHDFADIAYRIERIACIAPKQFTSLTRRTIVTEF